MPPYFGSSLPQNFHDRRPRRDRITGAETHAAGDESVGERLVAIHRDLGAAAGLLDLFELIKFREHIADRIGIAGM